MSALAQLVFPGQPLGASKGTLGVYVDSNGIQRSSLVGVYQDKTFKTPKHRPNAPAENSIVIGVITRLSSSQATMSIVVVDGQPLLDGDEYTGVIRSQDIRATDKDKIRIGDCFRGGDIVQGQVLSLGDQRAFYVTTARNDLGVLFATSDTGAPMEPYSWEMMLSPRDGTLEKRKVARPISE